MAGLVLKLRPHEQVLVNGVVMQNGDRRAQLKIKSDSAHVLRLRDALHPDDVDTPVKRVYYIAQLAVAGEAEPEEAARQIDAGLKQLAHALETSTGAASVDEAIAANRQRNFYRVMKTLQGILELEAKLLGVAPPRLGDDQFADPAEA
ncbi:MAG: flagellar biosynthesis repressor FlbT [Pseudomonadota bacterium]